MSTEGLQALHVVPPPIPLEDRPEESLTPEELVQLVRNMKKKVISPSS